MKNNIFNILLSAVLVLSGCSGTETIRIEPDAGITDYTPVVKEIISAHPEGGFVLEFADGTYPFYPEKAERRYVAVSNNDNGGKSIAFLLEDMRDVTVRGASSVFMFHGGMVPFMIMESENIKLEGFRIDYDYPFTLEGTVTANSAKDRSFTMRINDECLYEVREGQLFMKGYDWELPLGENIVFDPSDGSPYTSAERYEAWNGTPPLAEEIGERTVRISGFNAKEMPPVGSIYVDKGPHGSNRRYPGFIIHDSHNVLLDNITVYRSGAMALIAERSEDITCRNCSTCVRDGSGMMIASSADATHFIGCRGTVTLEGCTFESMLDDATNIHGTYMKIDSLLSDGSFHASFGHFQQEGQTFAFAGDSIRLINRNGLIPVAAGLVTGVSMIDENHYLISSDIGTEALKGMELAVENADGGCDVVIRDCIVRKNRARSLLLSTSGKILVEGCDFASMMAGIRICGDANYWFESGQTSDVTIRNNVFRNLGNGGWSPQAVLQIDPVIAADRRSCDRFYHDRIIFEGNTIYSAEDQVIYALSVKELHVTDNVFVDSKAYETRYPGLASVDVQYCGKTVIAGNDFSAWKKDGKISIHGCPEGSVTNDSPLELTDSPNRFYYEN